MIRTLFEIPIPFSGITIPIYAYGFMLMVGFLVTIYVARKKAKAEGLDPEIISNMGLYTIFAGILGGRTFYVIQNFGTYKHNILDAFKVYEGGLVFYGGLMASIAAIVIYSKVRKISVLKTIDIIAFAFALGVACGRIGCFLNGCCWGDICSSGIPWAVSFPKSVDINNMIDGSPAFLHHLAKGLVETSDGHSLPIHPTQIYSALGNISIFFIIKGFFKYRKRDGEVTLMFCALYSIMRFTVEIFRDDNLPLFDGLTISQNVSILVLLASIALIVIGRTRLKGQTKLA
ncbi:MAG: prolipoprotein diacylglyceryl transferase [Candidatus Brocadiaceae bacterium]|nr:prolipoprotein diacylglyceryl transferase [Candidatus Brocadiaceae bacterium]